MPTTILNRGRVTWTNLVKPTPEDIDELSERYPQFHPLNLQDCLTNLVFPKLDAHDDHLFLVVQFPAWDAKDRVSRPSEVDIFIAKGTLVTSHSGELRPLNDLFARAQADQAGETKLLERGASPLLYDILSALVDYCVPILGRAEQTIRHIEQDLFNEDTRHTLNEIALIRRDLIAIRRILKPQQEVIRELVRGNWPFIHDDLNIYWDDIAAHLAQHQATLDEQIEVVGGLSETIDTLASHRIDEVVRVLTIITVLTLPLSLLSTIFSMNVEMPYRTHPLLFFVVISAGVALTAILLWYLRKRRWL